MKFFPLIVIAAIFIISCSDTRNRDDLKQHCDATTLQLDAYKAVNALILSIPGKKNKENQPPPNRAKNGKYILNRSIVHIHDQNLESRVVNNEAQYLQMSFGFSRVAQQDEDIEKNVLPFQSVVNCLAGLKAEFAGNSIHQVNIPTIVEFSDKGSEIMLTGMKTFEMGFFQDGFLRIKQKDGANKGPTDNVDDINKTDSSPISNFYRNDENGEAYQLQNRVTLGNITISLINEYIRCVAPEENDKYDEMTEEQKKILSEGFEKCNTQSIKIKGLN